MIRFIGVLLLGVLLMGCEDKDPASEQECYQLPMGTHLPRLFNNFDSGLTLSYVSSGDGSDTLKVAGVHELPDRFRSSPIYDGENWFINWADFPSFRYFQDGENYERSFSHWLQYSGEGTYDYDIISFNAGEEHTYAPSVLHKDSVSAEHGFLSSAALPGGGLQVSWLDGRYTKVQEGAAAGAGDVEAQADDHGHGHGGGAMTLRTKALSDSVSVELDHRVCDCCNTATVATRDLTMVAYRDRSEHEIRDIGYVVKPTGGEWSTPKLVHADNWEISGCPVNGPALAANDAGNIAAIWYTAPADRAQINFARYDATADAFSPPVVLDDNIPLGRVDLQLAEDGTAYATALTTKEDTDDAFLTLWTISRAGGISRADLATTSAARSTGFPKIALFQDKLFWARTVLGEEKGQQYVEVCWR